MADLKKKDFSSCSLIIYNLSTDSGLCSIQYLGKTRDSWKAFKDSQLEGEVSGDSKGGVIGDHGGEEITAGDNAA